jgi:hypothetical protein
MRRAGARSCRVKSIVLKLVMRISKNSSRREKRRKSFRRTLAALSAMVWSDHYVVAKARVDSRSSVV